MSLAQNRLASCNNEHHSAPTLPNTLTRTVTNKTKASFKETYTRPRHSTKSTIPKLMLCRHLTHSHALTLSLSPFPFAFACSHFSNDLVNLIFPELQINRKSIERTPNPNQNTLTLSIVLQSVFLLLCASVYFDVHGLRLYNCA